MKKIIFYILTLSSFRTFAAVGTYNFHFNFSSVCNPDASWFDYYLGPTEDGSLDGNCKIDSSKTCHAYQQYATFFHESEKVSKKKTLVQTICDDLGFERCELLTIYIQRNANHTGDLLFSERSTQKTGSDEIIEVKQLTIESNSTLEGTLNLPGQDCIRELKFKLFRMN